VGDRIAVLSLNFFRFTAADQLAAAGRLGGAEIIVLTMQSGDFPEFRERRLHIVRNAPGFFPVAANVQATGEAVPMTVRPVTGGFAGAIAGRTAPVYGTVRAGRAPRVPGGCSRFPHAASYSW